MAGADGRLWLARQDYSGKVVAISVRGAIEQFAVVPPGDVVQRITPGANDDFWITLRSGTLARMTTSGAVTLFPGPWNANFDRFGGIVLGPDGSVCAAATESAD